MKYLLILLLFTSCTKTNCFECKNAKNEDIEYCDPKVYGFTMVSQCFNEIYKANNNKPFVKDSLYNLNYKNEQKFKCYAPSWVN